MKDQTKAEAQDSSIIDAVMDDIEVGIIITNRHLRIECFNKAVERFFGVDRGEVLGKDIRLVHREHLAPCIEEEERFREKVLAAYEENSYRESFQCRITENSGREQRWLQHLSSPLLSGTYQGGRIERYYDITEYKENEGMLRASGRFLRTIMSSVSEGIIVCDEDFRYQWWNEAMERLTGVRAREILGLTIAQADSIFQIEGIQALLDRSLRGENVRFTDIQYVAGQAGKKGWASGVCNPHIDSSGKIVGTVITLCDLSLHRRVQEKLTASEKRYRSVFDAVQDAIIVFEHDTGRILDANKYACELYGFKLEEMLTLSQRDLSAELERTAPVFKGEIQRIPIKYHRKRDGTVFPVEMSSSIYRQGGINISTFVIRDITERQKAEDALRESEERFRAVFESAQDPMFIKDTAMIYRQVNPSFARLFKRPVAEFVGLSDEDLFGREEAESIWEIDRRVLKGEVVDGEFTRKIFGNPATFHTIKTPLRDRTGSIVGLCGIARDITARKRAEEALEASRSELRSLTSELITVQERERKRISKELHDELGQALLALKLRVRCMEKKLSPSQKELREECLGMLAYLDEIVENVQRLSRDLSPLILENLGLSAALRWLTDEFGKRTQIQPSLHMQEIDHLFPDESKTLIFRVVQECLTNIYKHAGASHVRLSVKRKDSHVLFRVEDDGRGFSPDRLDHFQITEKGLGLVAMEERVRMLGGELEINSSEGKGTRVTFSAPIRPS